MALQKGRHLPTKLDGVTSHKPVILLATLVRKSFRFKSIAVYHAEYLHSILPSIAVGVLSRRCGFLWVWTVSNKYRSCIKNFSFPLTSQPPGKHTSFVRKQFPMLFAVCIIALSWRSLFSQISYCPYSLYHTQPTYGTVVPWDQTVDLCVFQDVI